MQTQDPGFDSLISVGHFSLVLPLGGQRLLQIAALHCSQTGLAMFICICGSAAISFSRTHHQRKREKFEAFL